MYRRPGIVPGQPARGEAFSTDAECSSWLTRGRQEYRLEPAPEAPQPTKRIAALMKKTRFCKHYLRGHCRFGDKCAYAHQAVELVPKPDLAKTRMCIHFAAGRCRNERCFFAHGHQELQSGAPEEEQDTISGRWAPDQVHPPMNQVWHLDREAEMELRLASLNISRVPPGLSCSDTVYQYDQLPQAPDNCGFKVRDRFQSLGTTSRTESTHLSRDHLQSLGTTPRTESTYLSNENMSQALLSPESSEGLEAPSLSDVGGIGNSNGYTYAWNETKPCPRGSLEAAAHFEVAQLGCREEMDSSSKDLLLNWLRSCEHAQYLSPTSEYKIVQLFLRDSSWAATFPNLAEKCKTQF